MDNRIGETVRFTKDLYCKYSSAEIENLTVFNFRTNKYEKSEVWGSEAKVDCLHIGGFNIEVSKNTARFFFGAPLQYGYFPRDPFALKYLSVGQTAKDFAMIGFEYFEKEYKRPSSMWDLAMFIDDYIYYVKNEMEECALDFHRVTSEIYQTVCETTEDDGLPF